MKKITFALCSVFKLLSLAEPTFAANMPVESETTEAPLVGDWFDANWFDEIIKIPLIIGGNTSWYANLMVGAADSMQTEGYCLFDNNSPRTVIYPSTQTSGTTDWYIPPVATCDEDETTTVQTDGMEYTGMLCRDRVCIGSASQEIIQDIHTTVCNDEQDFLDSTNVPKGDWTYYHNLNGVSNSVCGLGKEQASVSSLSFLSLASYNGDLRKNMYSFEIYPHLAYDSGANAFRNMIQLAEGKEPSLQIPHSLGASRNGEYMYALDMKLSYLTLGGYDKSDLDGDLTWYDTSQTADTWNITAVNVAINGINVNPSGDVMTPPEVNFQIGFPYLGFSKNTWSQFYDLMFIQWNPTLVNKHYCNSLQGNEFCYWHDTQCKDVLTYGDFTITLGDYDYSISMDHFLADTSSDGVSYDCYVFIVELDADGSVEKENFIRLGDPFFASFIPVFDVENDQIGLALSSRHAGDCSKTLVTEEEPVEMSEEAFLDFQDDLWFSQ